jgi:biopolymer transport protein ExbD
MSESRRRKRGVRKSVEADLQLLPLMNVFIVLIPMLLMSAVYLEVRTINMSLPSQAAAQEAATQAAPLELSIKIGEQAYVVEGNGVPAQTIAREAKAGGAGRPNDAGSQRLAAVLAQIVAAHPDNKEVRIVAEATTRYDEIVALMDIARSAGLPQVGLLGAAQGGS